jgi:exonuclease SbcC
MAEFKNKLLIAKGKECPTCGTVLQEANPDKEKEYLNEIELIKSEIETNENLINEANKIKEHNKLVNDRTNQLNSAKLYLLERKNELEDLSKKLNIIDSQKDLIEHNKKVEEAEESLERARRFLITLEEDLKEFKNHYEVFEANAEKIENNKKIDHDIALIIDKMNRHKMNIEDLESIVQQINREITVKEISIKNIQENLSKIREADREYKKYSVYLQAVHRDGIPRQIIKGKLPIINSKINNIIKDIANFKIELYITDKGDIKERFYFGDTKVNSLPLSMSSGSQHFISVLAIRDALHSVSHLTKPSLCAIDEGFGSLDGEKTVEVKGMLDYLKSKYKNVIIITHRSEIKDFVDKEIYISRKELSGDAWHSEISI